jgi:hypothetical protein
MSKLKRNFYTFISWFNGMLSLKLLLLGQALC